MTAGHRHTRVKELYPPGCWYCSRAATEWCPLNGYQLCDQHRDEGACATAPARRGRPPLPEDRPCTRCGEQLPAMAYDQRPIGYGYTRPHRYSACRHCRAKDGAARVRRHRQRAKARQS